MSVNKKVNFYSLLPDPSFGWDSTTQPAEVAVKNAIQAKFTAVGIYDIDCEGTQYRFQIDEITNEYIFGLFIKPEKDARETLAQTQIRDTTTNTVAPLEIPSNSELERYTFFLIDYDKRIMVIMSGSYSASIQKALEISLNNDSYHISVLPFAVQNTKEYIKKINKNLKVDFITTGGEFETLSDLSSLNQLATKRTVSMHIKKGKEKEATDLIASLNSQKYESVKLAGVIDEDTKIIIDLVKKTLTRSSSIEAEDYSTNNAEVIKMLLREQIQLLSNDI